MKTLDELDARLIATIDGGALEQIGATGTIEGILGDTTVYDLLAILLLYKCEGTSQVRRELDSIAWVEEAKEFLVKDFRRSSARRKRVPRASK